MFFPGMSGPQAAIAQGQQQIGQTVLASQAARQAAASSLPAAGGGAGLFSALLTPGVGTALTAGASVLQLLFGQQDDSDIRRFEAELASQDRNKQITAQLAGQSSEGVQQSIAGAQQAEAAGQQQFGSALQRFFM